MTPAPQKKPHYPVCPKCGQQGESTGVRDFNYNGGGEYFRCLNPRCEHKWCWT
jgi:tRNA(Ile2) C34 agmatinyltransferase TiaS